MVTSEPLSPGGFTVPGLLCVAACLLLAGCASPTLVTTLQQGEPHQLQAFTLQHYPSEGGLTLSLSSPKARHDWNRKSSVVATPQVLVHRDGVPVYEIRAQRGLLLGNNRLVQLDGTVKLVHLQEPSTVVTGERLRWDTGRGRMAVTVNLEVTRQDMQATAGWAEFDFGSKDLTLHDQVVVLDRSPPADDLHLEATTLHWNLGSGDLRAPGLVKGWQNDPAGEVQSLEGVNLTGNSQGRWLQLQAPVRLQTRRAGQWQARDAVLWWLDEQRLESPGLLEAQVGEQQISGRSAALDLQQGMVTIAEDCRFHQPGENLTAQQCRWDWQEKTIAARGGVLLQREQ